MDLGPDRPSWGSGFALSVDTVAPVLIATGPPKTHRWSGAEVLVASSEPLASWGAVLVDADDQAVPLGATADEEQRSLRLIIPSSGVAAGAGVLHVVGRDRAGNASTWSAEVVLGGLAAG